MCDLLVDYDAIDKSDVLNIQKYVMVKNKMMLGFIKQVPIELLCFSRSLANIVNIPGHTKWKSLNNKPCMTQPSLINLYLDEYIEGLRYYYPLI